MTLEDAKNKIDGYHLLVVEGIETEGDVGDTVGGFIASVDPSMFDDLHDYVFESKKKLGLM
jgi:hypothetical protein